MAMSDYSLSDIAAVSDGANGGFGNNGDGWWIILLFILLGGWGGNRGWGNQGGAGNVGGNELYPWMENQSALCNGFANVTAAVTNGFANAETAATARQMASMQQAFGLSQQFAECCCENRLGLANLGSDIAREACADRQAVSDGVRDILANNNANTQRIVDWLVEDRLDEKNDEIAQLRNQLNFANLAASQIAQDGRIIDGVYNRFRDCPVGTMPVYGSQPIFTCQPNYNCGCNQGCGCGM